MTRPLALNMHSAQKWAAVVSGTVWKTWGLSPSGTLEAKATRGPLIIWAKPTSGEEGEAVKLEAPKPSPLDLRVMVLNTSAHFERFRRAARGKVRASVRWKSSRKVRERMYARSYFDFLGYCGDGYDWEALERKAEGHKRSRLKRDREKQARRSEDRLFKVSSKFLTFNDLGNITNSRLEELEEARQVIRRGQPFAAFTWAKREGSEGDLAAYLTALGDLEALRFFLPFIDGRGHKEAYLKALTRLLQRAAYLAHVRRTVKPAPRRGRLPRPVYARPRPPSAPLAPPVA